MRQTANLVSALLILCLVGCGVNLTRPASPWGDLPPDRKLVA